VYYDQRDKRSEWPKENGSDESEWTVFPELQVVRISWWLKVLGRGPVVACLGFRPHPDITQLTLSLVAYNAAYKRQGLVDASKN
jgi:hypothetical protein